MFSLASIYLDFLFQAIDNKENIDTLVCIANVVSV